MLFDHERLDAYRTAIEFVALADGVVEDMPQGRSCLASQLHRASISIPLNIAEGAGEFSRNDKARFYRMALRSATECAAILDVCRQLRAVAEARVTAGRELFGRVVAMLTALVRSVGKSGTGSGSGSDHP